MIANYHLGTVQRGILRMTVMALEVPPSK